MKADASKMGIVILRFNMTQIPVYLLFVFFLLAAWFAWRYYDLRRRLKRYADLVRVAPDNPPAEAEQLESISNAVASLRAACKAELSALQAQNERLSTVLEQLTDGVIIVDVNGLVQFANPAAQRLFETSSALGHSVTEVIRSHPLVEAWRRCRQTGEIQSESVEIPARRQFLQVIAIPDAHADGSLILAQDLTRVRRLETVRRDFISNISHELRTPLASLKALTETLQNGALLDPEAGPRFLGRVNAEVDALTQMAQELLDLSRIESGQVELMLTSISPRSLLLSAAERMRMQVERANLKLNIECPASLPSIRADQSRLEQVLVNIIHNAVKFTRPGGEITLEAVTALGGVRFSVRDTGVGIPADSLSRIFERFYRVDRSRAGSGTGLGLSISRHIIEAHGGKIWAESVEGKGSVFYFLIPLITP